MTTIGVHEDTVLWEAVRTGDSDAFATIFDQYVDAIYNYCAHRVGSYSDADDLTATVFLEAWRCRAKLPLTTPTALPLLYGIAARVCLRHHRSLRRYVAALRRFPVEGNQPDHAADVAAAVDYRAALAAMTVALRRLPKDQRDVVELCLIGQVDTKTAAASLAIPEGTVKSRLSRARSQLRVDLASVRLNTFGETL
ncbi:RNA polymerase sigma factor [Actinocrinis sp.]|uniref:RNA polymerase sigma factor n=1 Tax=Actinocrinis sp. TaxID=1920516 RepID=UPI002DDD414F|nr:RNA polymerase sigma factor [Actinocrinis sp.]